ncbi:hypothetical protein CBR_g38417 [Chara braunii]|uniref:WD repeat-containing protein 44 n=1 Tax=Chara braunii TaxID=69332 RepID=A0A388JNN9_CHABU|nr:hypothetical protein CBR_g38417 [Chara braunii]|eukprot:GBG59391.1 hypothetical protein CBR_g38417 [Chara braunii]
MDTDEDEFFEALEEIPSGSEEGEDERSKRRLPSQQQQQQPPPPPPQQQQQQPLPLSQQLRPQQQAQQPQQQRQEANKAFGEGGGGGGVDCIQGTGHDGLGYHQRGAVGGSWEWGSCKDGQKENRVGYGNTGFRDGKEVKVEARSMVVSGSRDGSRGRMAEENNSRGSSGGRNERQSSRNNGSKTWDRVGEDCTWSAEMKRGGDYSMGYGGARMNGVTATTTVTTRTRLSKSMAAELESEAGVVGIERVDSVSRMGGGGDVSSGVDKSRAVSQGKVRERSLTPSAAQRGGSSFSEMDLSVWKDLPGTVKERRERFWQSLKGRNGKLGSSIAAQSQRSRSVSVPKSNNYVHDLRPIRENGIGMGSVEQGGEEEAVPSRARSGLGGGGNEGGVGRTRALGRSRLRPTSASSSSLSPPVADRLTALRKDGVGGFEPAQRGAEEERSSISRIASFAAKPSRPLQSWVSSTANWVRWRGGSGVSQSLDTGDGRAGWEGWERVVYGGVGDEGMRSFSARKERPRPDWLADSPEQTAKGARSGPLWEPARTSRWDAFGERERQRGGGGGGGCPDEGAKEAGSRSSSGCAPRSLSRENVDNGRREEKRRDSTSIFTTPANRSSGRGSTGEGVGGGEVVRGTRRSSSRQRQREEEEEEGETEEEVLTSGRHKRSKSDPSLIGSPGAEQEAEVGRQSYSREGGKEGSSSGRAGAGEVRAEWRPAERLGCSSSSGSDGVFVEGGREGGKNGVGDGRGGGGEADSMLRVHDFKSGKEIEVEMIYRIRDLDTGKEFILGEDLCANPRGAGKEGNRVHEVVHEVGKGGKLGKDMTLDEFQESLGIYPLTREMAIRERREGRGGGVKEEKGGDKKEGEGGGKKKGRWFRSIRVYGGGSKEKKGGKSEGGGAETGQGGNTPRSDTSSTKDYASCTEGEKAEGRKAGKRKKGEQQPSSTETREKVHHHRKTHRDLTDLKLGQELRAHDGAIWTIKFSRDGKYMASAGQDKIVKVWLILDRKPSSNTRGSGASGEGGEGERGRTCRADDECEVGNSGRLSSSSSSGSCHSLGSNGNGSRLGGGGGSAPAPPGATAGSWGGSFYIQETPHRVFKGHTGDVLDMSWSKSQFLLTSSMDNSVRLWHISVDQCLRVFPHSDFVTCVDFNPVDDKFFISGSFDDKLRIWNIPDFSVADWTDVREIVTTACYTRDGKGAIVGSHKGICRFYSITGNHLKLEDSVEVRSSRGKNARSKKITGVQHMPGDGRKVLITSNDSRLRLYDGMKLECKYKGHRNASSLAASFSANGDFLICASECSHVFVWNTVNSYVPSNLMYTSYKKDKHQSYEYFYSPNVTVAKFWPLRMNVNGQTSSNSAAGGHSKSSAPSFNSSIRQSSSQKSTSGKSIHEDRIDSRRQGSSSDFLNPAAREADDKCAGKGLENGGGGFEEEQDDVPNGGRNRDSMSRPGHPPRPTSSSSRGSKGSATWRGSSKKSETGGTGADGGGVHTPSPGPGTPLGSEAGGSDPASPTGAGARVDDNDVPGVAHSNSRALLDLEPSPERPGPWAKPRENDTDFGKSVAWAQAAGENAFAAASAMGMVIVTGNYAGEIRTFLNFGAPVKA